MSIQTDSIAEQFFALEQDLAADLERLTLLGDQVHYVYNPISYASVPHLAFLRKFLRGERRVLFLGLNPGPWGMAQTGVPFGQVDLVQSWLGISGEVGRPEREHPKRPVEGFGCRRREVSGERLYNLFRELCRTPEAFFDVCALYNHCPLAFLAESGKNVTPVDLKQPLRTQVLQLCDEALLGVLRLLRVEMVVGVGRFAQQRAEKVVREGGLEGVRVGFLHHPSPASASANRGWADIARRQLLDLGVLDWLKRGGEGEVSDGALSNSNC